MFLLNHRYTFPLLLFSLLSLSLLTSCENDIAVINTITSASEKNLPAESGKNVQIIYSDSAQMRAKLTAPVLNNYAGKKPYREMPKGLEVIFYDNNKKEESKLTADYAIGFDNDAGLEHMEAKRNVVVINKKGDTLNTEHLIWNVLTQKIYTENFVKITTRDEIIYGDGLTANQDFSNYEIKNPKGQVSVGDKEGKKSK